MLDTQRVPLNQHFGDLLKEYIVVIVEVMRLHNILISTFPLLTARPGDNGTEIQTKIRKGLDSSHSLQAQMRLFKGAWEADRARLPPWPCYETGPAQWIDDGITRNNTNSEQAMKMISDFTLKVRRLELRSNKGDVASANIQRSRGIADTVSPAILSYNNVILMKPSTKGRHDMSYKNWRRFKEEAQQWFVASGNHPGGDSPPRWLRSKKPTRPG